MAPHLPVELIEEIVSLSSKSDLPALCRTSKLFREIVEPLIYRHICIPCGDTLTDGRRTPRADDDRVVEMFHWIVGLYNSLKGDDRKAAMVERVEVTDLPEYLSNNSDIVEIPGFSLVNYTPSHTSRNLDKISTVIAAVLSVLPNLPFFHLTGGAIIEESLDDDDDYDRYGRRHYLAPQIRQHLAPLHLLSHVFCPTLREFHLDFPHNPPQIEPPLPHFIRRHSNLIGAVLHISQYEVPRDRVELCMPSLERFEAPAGYFQYFADPMPSKLSHVSMDLTHVAGMSRNEILSLLKRELAVIRSFPSLELLTLIDEKNLRDIESMGVVAARFPNIEQLEIRHKSYPCLLEKPRESIERMTQAFARFKGLRRFTYVSLRSDGRASARVNTEVDLSTVRRWGLECPTLMYCEIYRTVWQRMQGEWVIASL